LTVKEILDAAGEELDLIACDKNKKDCERIEDCLCHEVWTRVTELINDFFSSMTLASIIEGNRRERPGIKVNEYAGRIKNK
jgi:Rrf2 family iron-sulfur cluster assembly transcriptional regulator